MEHDHIERPAASGLQTPQPSEAFKQQVSFLWEVQKYLNHYVTLADSRATATLAISSGVIGALYQTKVHTAFASATLIQWMAWETLAAVTAFIGLVLGVSFCILAVIPRLKKTPEAGFIYWESILQHGSAATYWQQLHGKSIDELGELLAGNVFVAASIATRKYTLLRRGMLAAFIGGLLGATVLVFR